MIELKNKNVLVIGLGKSGVAAARFAAEAGAFVTVSDIKKADELSQAVMELKGLKIKFLFEQVRPSADGADIIVTSPGVSPNVPALMSARDRGIPIVGEMEFAVQTLDRPLIAVTGTNGKTTTTALIGHLFETSGVRACVAGNIGTPLLAVLDLARKADFVVLEVSSFQIETAPSISPMIALWLNATPDHLDRYETFEAYVECKARLLKRVARGGYGIYNAADDVVRRSSVALECTPVPFDATGRIFGKNGTGNRAWFGEGSLWVQTASNPPNGYPISNVKLEGVHNRENMLAALLACELAGAEPWALREGIATFRGLPHRIELVGEFKGVRYYDDSKGTNVGATIRALESFAEPVVLIAGGLSKGVDFTPLKKCVRGRVKKLVLIGEAADELEKTLSGDVAAVKAANMEEAVGVSVDAVDPGDVVLLSPACASFDMFLDYADRGNKFADAVRKIAGA